MVGVSGAEGVPRGGAGGWGMGRAGGKLVAGGQSPTSVVVGGSIKKRLSREPAGVDCVISSVAIGCRWPFPPYPPIDRLNPFSLGGC